MNLYVNLSFQVILSTTKTKFKVISKRKNQIKAQKKYSKHSILKFHNSGHVYVRKLKLIAINLEFNEYAFQKCITKWLVSRLKFLKFQS